MLADIICPFCYAAKKRIDKAIKEYKEGGGTKDIIVKWKPFDLRPDLTEIG